MGQPRGHHRWWCQRSIARLSAAGGRSPFGRARFPDGDLGIIGVLGVGTLRRWRWTFWLIVVAFLFGVLHMPASILEVAGVLPATGTNWYVLSRPSSACFNSASGWRC